MFAALVVNEENYELYRQLAEKDAKHVIDKAVMQGHVVVKDTINGDWYWTVRGEFDEKFRFVYENYDKNRFAFVSHRRG